MSGIQQAQAFTGEIRRQVSARYLVYLPEGYGQEPAKRWPLILFLHGSGERGDDLALVRKHGPLKVVGEGTALPFVIVAPQCPADQVWSLDVLEGLLDHTLADYAVDPSRVYLTGLSMGGYGTWEWGLQSAGRFAAMAPICGGGNRISAYFAGTVPTWAFHGAKDDLVPAAESERMVEALRERGVEVRFTVYPEARHDSWTETYNNPELYEWFLSHQR
ncbi:MAG: prolyl oligopeptidase family serine peptidase [Mycobacterium leprae]